MSAETSRQATPPPAPPHTRPPSPPTPSTRPPPPTTGTDPMPCRANTAATVANGAPARTETGQRVITCPTVTTSITPPRFLLSQAFPCGGRAVRGGGTGEAVEGPATGPGQFRTFGGTAQDRRTAAPAATAVAGCGQRRRGGRDEPPEGRERDEHGRRHRAVGHAVQGRGPPARATGRERRAGRRRGRARAGRGV